jgi:hypothetical protein
MTTRLQKVIDVFEWYEDGYAPSNTWFKEHGELLCFLHEMENHESYKLGHIEGWPTTLDATWVRSEVGTMKGHLSSLIEHAPAHDQFRDMKEAITNGDEEVMAWPALIESYTNGRGWLRSAG